MSLAYLLLHISDGDLYQNQCYCTVDARDVFQTGRRRNFFVYPIFGVSKSYLFLNFFVCFESHLSFEALVYYTSICSSWGIALHIRSELIDKK